MVQPITFTFVHPSCDLSFQRLSPTEALEFLFCRIMIKDGFHAAKIGNKLITKVSHLFYQELSNYRIFSFMIEFIGNLRRGCVKIDIYSFGVGEGCKWP